MKEEWKKFYKGIVKGKNNTKCYKGFVAYCELLEQHGGKPLSDYKSNTDNVTFEIFDMITSMACNHVKRYVNNLVKVIKELEENQDEFISFKKTNKDRFVQVTFKQKDGGIVTISTTTYSNYIRGRNNFYNELNKNGHIALSPYLGNDKKVFIDYKCGHNPTENTPNRYVDHGQRCPICSNRTIVPYVNDFYTIHSDLLKYFVNPGETIGAPVRRGGKHHLRCPICSVGEKWSTFENLIAHGFSCPCCDNKTSYFNRFMNILLTELNEDFDAEKEFDWCNFLSYDGTKTQKGIYDFVIEKKKLIIEMDGGFHSIDNNMSGQSKEESKYIDNMKDFLAIENGYKVIRIDCCYNKLSDRFNMLIENINKSLLIEHYDISNVNMEEINKKALESVIKKVCDYWNQKYTIGEIKEMTQLSTTTVKSYLVIGHSINWCVYNKSESKSRARGFKIKAVQNNNLIGVYQSRQDAVFQLKDKYNITFDRDLISATLNGKRETYKGIKFIKIDNDEYRDLIKEQLYELDLSLIPGNTWLN